MTLPKPRKIEAERYEGGLSQFKKIDNLIKLSANESALGPSPRAIEAFQKEKDKIFKYPESESSSLRDIISEKFNINSERIRVRFWIFKNFIFIFFNRLNCFWTWS